MRKTRFLPASLTHGVLFMFMVVLLAGSLSGGSHTPHQDAPHPSAAFAAAPTPSPSVDAADLLHPKSRAGVMPPAYGLDPEASVRLADVDAPPFETLSPYQTTETGSWAQVLVADDLTGDGRTSVAVATARYFDEPNDQALHIFTGWERDAMEWIQMLPGGWNPEAATADDLNHDGRTDVVLALAGDQHVALYTQPMTTPTLLPLDGAPDAVATGDLNSDLRADLAVIAPHRGLIHVLPGSPAGLSPDSVTLEYPTGGYDALASGDLDNDGDDDLVALRGAGYPTDALVVYFQEHGTFPLSTTLTPEDNQYVPHSMAVGDVNSDGLDDVVVTAGGNMPNTSLSVFLQHADGLAQEPVIYETYHLPSAVEIADIDHDGLNDVVVVHDGWRIASIFTQQSDGTLADYAVVEIPYSSRYRPDALEVADLDGNGGLDVALVEQASGLVVMANMLSAPTSTITFPPAAVTLPPGPLLVSGEASTDAVAVEVRLRGATAWLPATLTGSQWQITLPLPDQPRAWWIESRAINADGRYQAPPDRQRIRSNAICHNVFTDITLAPLNGQAVQSVLVPSDALSATTQLGGFGAALPPPAHVTFQFANGSSTPLNNPTRQVTVGDVLGYTFETSAQPGPVTVNAGVPYTTTRSLVAYSDALTETLHSQAISTTLQYMDADELSHIDLTLPAPLPTVTDLQVNVVLMQGDTQTTASPSTVAGIPIDEPPGDDDGGSDDGGSDDGGSDPVEPGNPTPPTLRVEAGETVVEQVITETGDDGVRLISVSLDDVLPGTRQVRVSLSHQGYSSRQLPNPGQESPLFLIGITAWSTCTITDPFPALVLPGDHAEQSATVDLPIAANTIQHMAASDLTISYDETVLRPIDATTGAMTSDWSLAVNTNVPGEVNLAMASPSSPVSGSGIIAWLTFEVIGIPGDMTPLQFHHVLLNDGAIQAITQDGTFTVSTSDGLLPGPALRGTVAFWSDESGIADVQMTLIGEESAETMTTATGEYELHAPAPGSYVLVPTMANDPGSSMSAYDASLVLQHAAGLIELTGYAATAADVNHNGDITSMDALLINQAAVDLITPPFVGQDAIWVFEPPQRSYPSLRTHQDQQDFIALLPGDVSGNWTPVQSRRLRHASPADGVSPASITVSQGGDIAQGETLMTVQVDPAGEDLYGIDLVLEYDATQMQSLSVDPGPQAAGMTVTSNTTEPGIVRVALAGATPLTEPGALLTLRFGTDTARANQPDGQRLALLSAQVNEVPLMTATTTRRVYLPLVGR